jgi:D-alanine--poly(phosphoribitol) ligase subunit 1
MKAIIFGGEVFPKKELKKIFFNLQNTKFINVYGPTECTCICSNYEITKKDFGKKEMLRFAPFGHDLAKNFKYLIVKKKKILCKKGEVGELLIGGDNVSLGYFNNKLTAEKFIQNPFHNLYRDIFYKSGDLVYIDKKNNKIYFSGRDDSQIKFKGYRIELLEIENTLNSFKSILQAAVCYGIKNKNKEITAWITCAEKINLDRILIQIKKKHLAFNLKYYYIFKCSFACFNQNKTMLTKNKQFQLLLDIFLFYYCFAFKINMFKLKNKYNHLNLI